MAGQIRHSSSESNFVSEGELRQSGDSFAWCELVETSVGISDVVGSGFSESTRRSRMIGGLIYLAGSTVRPLSAMPDDERLHETT